MLRNAWKAPDHSKTENMFKRQATRNTHEHEWGQLHTGIEKIINRFLEKAVEIYASSQEEKSGDKREEKLKADIDLVKNKRHK